MAIKLRERLEDPDSKIFLEAYQELNKAFNSIDGKLSDTSPYYQYESLVEYYREIYEASPQSPQGK